MWAYTHLTTVIRADALNRLSCTAVAKTMYNRNM